ncbi:MarR family winged helix-turn-helix transcriptional regulator [Streptomyces radicis]|uniref:MarR family transcriptional regulator n=1 Tax=Streptomyces radicis TaxID=1750517 RepID=A0A3A9WBZ2_9ACTN|nr:MarR family transcriptional regulator [Streptomyces radicis]RKN06884.1 MarR family transcriptional regulator [Streptomyces radicis]RKN19502.1 MarR family transcriptional regulator [Streptomyces radicis]
MTDIAAPAIDPRLVGFTAFLARRASVRAERLALAQLPRGRRPRELTVLTLLAEEGPHSQARLASRLEVNRTVMISLIDGLEGADLVRRERDPADRRRYALRLTDAGAAELARMDEATDRAERALHAPLSTPAARRRLGDLLRSLVPDLAAALPARVTARTGFLLARVAWRLGGRREAGLRAHGIEPRCVAMLVALDVAQPCTQERLAAALGVAGPSIVAAVDDLHTGDLIRRDRNPADRREHILCLTPTGADHLTRALDAEGAVQREIAADLGEREASELNGLLLALLSPRGEGPGGGAVGERPADAR